jgi:hypothetical protein
MFTNDSAQLIASYTHSRHLRIAAYHLFLQLYITAHLQNRVWIALCSPASNVLIAETRTSRACVDWNEQHLQGVDCVRQLW